MLGFHDLAWVGHTTYICNHNGFAIKDIVTPKVLDITDNFDMSLDIGISCFLAEILRTPDKVFELMLSNWPENASILLDKSHQTFENPSLSIRYQRKFHQFDQNHCGKNLPRHTSYLLLVDNLTFIQYLRTFVNASLNEKVMQSNIPPNYWGPILLTHLRHRHHIVFY